MSDAAAAPAPAGGESSAAPAELQAPDTSATGAPASGQQTASEEFEELEINGSKKRIPRAQLKSWAQRGLAGDERFREAARLRQEAEAEWEAAKQNPAKLRDILSKRGFDPKAVLPKLLLEEAETESLTPAEREAKELRAKLEAIEQEKKTAEEKAREQQTAALREKHSKTYSEKFAVALKSVGIPVGTPQTAWAVQRMVQLELANIESPEPLAPEELAAVLREDLEQEHVALFGAMPPDALLKRLGGPESPTVKALVQAFVASRQQATAPKTQQPAPAANATPPRDADGKFTKGGGTDRDSAAFERFLKLGY